MRYQRKYNEVLDLTDISEASGIIEPVTLQEMKDFLRLEGFSTDGINITSEAPLSKTLAQGATTIQDDLLINATILTLAREGTIYTKSLVVGNRKFVHDSATGIVSFQDQGNIGGEGIDITYGYTGASVGDDAYDFDNDLIEELIVAAREAMERFTGRSLVPHTWKALLTNLSGEVWLPRSNGIALDTSGPVLDSIIDCEGNTIEEDDYSVYGSEFAFLRTPLKERMTVTYSVIPTVPKRIKQAIMRDVAFHYENRNDEPGELAIQAQAIARQYQRPEAWLA